MENIKFNLKRYKKTIVVLICSFFSANCFSGCSSNNPEYLVSFNGNGGTLVSGEAEQIVTNPDDIKPPTFEMRGYIFNGWDIPLNTITESTDVKAQWKIENYTINYHLDGGTNSPLNPAHFNITSENIVLKEAIKPGYAFDYWSTSDGTIIKTIYPANAKDYDVFANYVTADYSIY